MGDIAKEESFGSDEFDEEEWEESRKKKNFHHLSSSL